MRDYAGLDRAVWGLLGEVCSLVNGLGMEYAVVGGWSPVLLNSSPTGHPGTKDVDLLFSCGATTESLREVVETLLASGYLVSAKHPFQALRIIEVAGTRFVFNVDILHPTLQFTQPELFVDQLILPVRVEEFDEKLFTMASIALPSAAFIFDGHTVQVPLECDLPNGDEAMVEIPVMDEAGLIVTKSSCVTLAKRPRDAFDIYLAVVQARDYEDLVRGVRELANTDPDSFSALGGLLRALRSGSEFALRVQSYMPGPDVKDPDAEYARPVSQFLLDVRFPGAGSATRKRDVFGWRRGPN